MTTVDRKGLRVRRPVETLGLSRLNRRFRQSAPPQETNSWHFRTEERARVSRDTVGLDSSIVHCVTN